MKTWKMWKTLNQPTAWRALLFVAVLAAGGAIATTTSNAARGAAQTRPQTSAQTPPQTPPKNPSPPSSVTPPPTAAESGVYRIGPEDVLDISVWKNTELTRTVSVRPDGRISLPLLNDVQAANLTPMQLRDTLVKGLAAYVAEPEVSVIVKEIHSARVSVVGMVKTPGRYDLRSQATVLDALAMAGGFTDFAKRDRVLIYRRDGSSWKTLDFSYGRLINDADFRENFVILPGDIVVVP